MLDHVSWLNASGDGGRAGGWGQRITGPAGRDGEEESTA